MRSGPRIGHLLAVVVPMDVAIAAGALIAAHREPAAALCGVAAAVLLVAHAALRGPAARLAVLGGLVAVLFLVPQATLIAARPAQAPVQDGLLITEAAADRLARGLDPYGHDYLDDPALRAFYLPELPVNPLLGHFVYPPGAALLALPGRLAGGPRANFAWAWLVGLPLLALAALAAAGRAGLVAVALNPVLLLDYLYLFNDLFYMAAGLAAIALLARRRGLAAGALLGLALVLKQQAVLLVPAAALLAWLRLDGGGRRRFLTGLLAVPLLVVAPFLAWSAHDFLADTAAYFYGSGAQAFPIRGPGLPGLLLRAGLIPSRWDPYPAAPLQAAAVLPLLALAARDLGRRFGWTRFWAWLALEALAVFLLGRTLAPNYLTLAILLGSLALASAVSEHPPGEAPIGGGEKLAAGQGGIERTAAARQRGDLPAGQGSAG